MSSYTVVGGLEVAGKIAGESLTEAELGEANVGALIEGGHIVATHTKADKAVPTEE